MQKTKPTLLLVIESNGRAVPLARITDPNMLRAAGFAAVREKRAQAAVAGGFLARRLEREADELESLSV